MRAGSDGNLHALFVDDVTSDGTSDRRGGIRFAKLLGDSVYQVIETYGHLMPENLADAVAMIDRKIGRNEVSATQADEVAAMRAEIARLREELATARAA